MALHKQASLGDRHAVENWVYANAAARAAATGFVSDDVGKIAFQTDTGVYYRLTATTPTWVSLAGVAPADLGIIPQNSKSADYTTVLADAGKHLFHPSADTTPRTWTIDSNANVPYLLGTVLTFVNQNGAGDITITITADTMRLGGDGDTGDRTLAPNGIATALKVTATEWIISGAGLS